MKTRNAYLTVLLVAVAVVLVSMASRSNHSATSGGGVAAALLGAGIGHLAGRYLIRTFIAK